MRYEFRTEQGEPFAIETPELDAEFMRTPDLPRSDGALFIEALREEATRLWRVGIRLDPREGKQLTVINEANKMAERAMNMELGKPMAIDGRHEPRRSRA